MKWKINRNQIKVFVMTTLLLITLVSGSFIFTNNVSAAQGPEKPTDPFPKDGATDISVNPKLSVNVTVDEGKKLNLTFYNAKNGSKIGDIYNVTDNSQKSRVSLSWSNLEYSATYRWYVEVSNGNNTNVSETWSFTTIPDIPPRITDNTGTHPVNGEPFIFNSTVIDNDKVDKVRVNYTTDVWDHHENISMDNSSQDHYIKSINEVYPACSYLNYTILACDINGNWNSTELVSLEVTDNDRPDIRIHSEVPDSQLLDKSVNITAEVIDNRNLRSVLINVTDPDGSSYELPMENVGSTYYYNKIYTSIGRYEYRITAEDMSGNIEWSGSRYLVIEDKTKPEIEDIAKPKTFTGKSYEFKCIVTDNNMVSEVYVEYWFGNNAYDPINESLRNSKGDTWEESISIPTDEDESLNYILSARDLSGNWNSTLEREIEVIDDIPPTPVSGGSRTVKIGDVVKLDASESHDNIGIIKYEWLIEGITVDGKVINYIFTDVKEYEVTLKLWDECGNKGQETFTILAEDDKKPIADAGTNLNVDEDTEVVLDGSGSSDNVQIENYTWSIDEETELYGETPNYTFEDPGTFFVKLKVTDEAGNYDIDIITVWVKDLTDPVAEAGKNWTIYTNQRVKLNGSDSYDNYKISSYEWHIENEVYYGEEILHEFTEVGDFKVTLEVTDEAGNISTDSIYVYVKDGKKPTADASEDSVVVVDEEIMLDAKRSSDNVRIVNYTWVVVEKNKVFYGENPVHEFKDSGTYTVRLTVRDANNNIDQDAIKVDVEKKEEPLSILNILLPIVVFASAVGGLFAFFYIYKPEGESEEVSEEKTEEETEESAAEEESTTDHSKEEIISKLESGELTPKQLEDLMAESQKKMRKDIAEIYQYLEVLRSKAQEYRKGKAEDKDSKSTSDEKTDQDRPEKEEEKPGPDQETESEQKPESQDQAPTTPQGPPDMDVPDEEGMGDMMDQLEGMDDSEAPQGFPTPDEDEEPPSLEDASETGDISQDDIDDLFH